MFSFCSLFFLKTNGVIAQDTSAFIVVGIELGGMNQSMFLKSNENGLGNGLFTSGVILEFPFKNKFSFGTGLVYSRYGGVRTHEKSGLTRINEDDIMESEVLRSGIKLSYFSIPIRMIYRLKCNCVYTQLGVQPTFYYSNSNNYNYNSFYTIRPENYSDHTIDSLNKMNWVLDFGIGFKANFRENIRLIFLPSYHRVLNPFFDGTELSPRNFLRLAFSLQYAFFKQKPF